MWTLGDDGVWGWERTTSTCGVETEAGEFYHATYWMDSSDPKWLNNAGLKFFFDQGKCQCDEDEDVWYATAASVATHSAAPANVTAVDVGDEKLLSDFFAHAAELRGDEPKCH